MADLELRKLEREALQGDEQARDKLLRELLRTRSGTWEGLVADVIARPDDDLPRLLFARWLRLEDQDVARATLIDSQVALARRETYYSALKRMRREIPALIEKHQARWLKPLKLQAQSASFERGFVAELRCYASDLVQHADAVFAREPVSKLHLDACGAKTLEAICSAPWIGRIERLKLRGDVGDDGAEVLANAPGLSNLRGLNLGECGIGPEGVQALAASETLTNLERLSLTGNELYDDGPVAIAASPTFQNLTALYLARAEIGDDGLRAIADSPHLQKLERLGLDGNETASDGAYSALAASPNLPALTWVELPGWGGPKGAALTALQERFPRLRRC